MARRVFRGYISLKVTQAVSGGLALNTQVNIPGSAMPRNPDNVARPGAVNVAGEASVEFQGFKTPTVRIIGLPKTSWLTASLLNSLIMLLDGTTGNTTGFAIGLNDSVGTRVYDVCRCERVILTGNPALTAVILDFKAIYGDSEAAVPTTFTPPSASTGQLVKAKQVLWSAGADKVREWGLVLERDQGWDMQANGTGYAADILSGALRGVCTLGQDPDNTATPADDDTNSGTATLQIGVAGAGVQFALKLSRDEQMTPHDPSIVTTTKSYAGIDKADGAGFVVITAL